MVIIVALILVIIVLIFTVWKKEKYIPKDCKREPCHEGSSASSTSRYQMGIDRPMFNWQRPVKGPLEW